VATVHVAVTGSSGLIGSALTGDLRAADHRVTRLVRAAPRADDEARWTPGAGCDAKALDGTDAVVHLAGAGIGNRRWSEAYKREIRDSRVLGTRTIATALAGLDNPPRVLVCASGTAWYGDTADRTVDESADRGAGFLAEVVRDWEAAAEPARAARIRVVHLRTGLVQAAHGPMAARVVPLFRLGLGGRLGSGRQWMSWISLHDGIAAIRFLIDRDDIAGPVNLTAPEPVTNAAYTKALGRALHRPTVLPVPRPALRLVLGELADEGVLISQRVIPARLVEAGFTFRHRDIDSALAAIV
jgi:uncharacterized protein (TIGR01777 family)